MERLATCKTEVRFFYESGISFISHMSIAVQDGLRAGYKSRCIDFHSGCGGKLIPLVAVVLIYFCL